MNSFIGYESMFAKDNANYTRTWMADYSPYYLLGAGASYPVNDQLTLGLYLLSDYDYLAYRSNQPKYASQLIWSIDSQWKLTQNLFAGPEQRNTETQYWRYFSDTILQWTEEDISVAGAYDVGTERVAVSEQYQALWMASALWARWHIDGPWSVALRPEVYWDADGRMTGNKQTIKAVTATLEYKIPLDSVWLALRTEYRFDESSGKQGGFFRNRSGGAELIDGQHLVLFSCLLSFDKQ